MGYWMVVYHWLPRTFVLEGSARPHRLAILHRQEVRFSSQGLGSIKMGVFLRTPESQEKYRAYIRAGGLQSECALCSKEAKHRFSHWKIICNDFPYDLIADVHDMIVPIRHVDEGGITEEEWQEYHQIKADFIQQYDYLVEATNKNKSIPAHFHIHLIVGKKLN